MKRKIIYTTLITSLASLVFCSAGTMTVDPLHKQAKVCKDSTCTTYKVINFAPSGGATPVTVASGTLSGYAWGEELGWINFSPSGTGVTYSQASGTLAGHAWASASGWINFRPSNSGTVSLGVPVGVALLSNGNLYGWAFASGVGGGWILFDCAQASTCVTFVDQTPAPAAPPTNSGGFFAPPAPAPLPAAPEPTALPPTTLVEPPTPPTPPQEPTPVQPEPKPEKESEAPQQEQEPTPETTTEKAPEQTTPTVEESSNAESPKVAEASVFSASGFFSVLNPFTWFGGTPSNSQNNSNTPGNTPSSGQRLNQNTENGGTPINETTNNGSWTGKVIQKVANLPSNTSDSIVRATYSLFDVFVALLKYLVY